LRRLFAVAETLALRIPVRRLVYAKRMDVFDEVHRAILSDLHS
jgi:hypothetical protein